MEHTDEVARQYECAKKHADKMCRSAFILAESTGLLDVLERVSPPDSGDKDTADAVRRLSDGMISTIVSLAIFGAVCANERMYRSMLQEPASDTK